MEGALREGIRRRKKGRGEGGEGERARLEEGAKLGKGREGSGRRVSYLMRLI